MWMPCSRSKQLLCSGKSSGIVWSGHSTKVGQVGSLLGSPQGISEMYPPLEELVQELSRMCLYLDTSSDITLITVTRERKHLKFSSFNGQ